MMHLHINQVRVEFRLGETLAGTYRQSDLFKPHLHPLCTPRGHCVTSTSPHDHKHHKALMFALRAADVNFWEETATLPGEVAGLQRHVEFFKVVGDGEMVGFSEKLLWSACDGSLETFEETREIQCRHAPEKQAFIWTWSTSLTALRNLHLVQSQWSHDLKNGKKVNYHGLGIRFRRDFGGMTRNHQLHVDGAVYQENFQQKMGATPREVTFIGSLDETWPVEKAGVTFHQEQNFPLYVMEDYIPFMALGPTNLEPLTVEKGHFLKASYRVDVFDFTT